MYDQLAPYYDQLHAELGEDIPLLLQLATQQGDPILDVGCGTGRVMIPLLEAGFLVDGVDRSEQMLALLKGKTERGTLYQGDMLQIDLEKRYRLIIISYNTLMHFDRLKLNQLLQRLRLIAAAGCRLFIDLTNPFWLADVESDDQPYEDRSFLVGEDQFTQWARNEHDLEAQTIQTDWTYQLLSKSGEKREWMGQTTYHYLFPHELQMALSDAGWRLREMWGGYDQRPFTEESERCLLWATL